MAGAATSLIPRRTTRIQLTDFRSETALLRILGPNRWCSPSAMRTALRIADFASS
jgi:hypothetical protein